MKRKSHLSATLALSAVAGLALPAHAEGTGDQILDGIGETALIARYVFNGDVRDWSRNNLHGEVRGGTSNFEKSEQFGKVLSLPADNGTHVTLPNKTLLGTDSLSVSGWVHLRSNIPGARLFDFGSDARNCFYALSGDADSGGFKAVIAANDSAFHTPAAPAIKTKQWTHFAVVLDAPAQTLTTYLDGKQIHRVADVKWNAADILNDDSPDANLVYLGRSRDTNGACLDAQLHDFRIYRTPLSAKQVARIRTNVLTGEDSGVVEADDRPDKNRDVPAPFASELVAVPDIDVETQVGILPELPRHIPAHFRQGSPRHEVRVIWPAPTDNQPVRKAGSYTVTGRVAGTRFEPTATVKVVTAKAAPNPERNIGTFPLGRVLLTPDSQGRETKFIENRNKFVDGLAKTNPDDFLYMFRNTFGQQQPAGATPLGVWDSQETKLRGHASGHYLTAIAQACASSGYDPKLQAEFADKMEYLIDTLDDLAQMSGRPRKDGGEHQADPSKVPPGPGKKDFDSDLSVDGIRTDYWNWGKGFISAYPPDQFIMLEHGASYGGQNSQIWAPYYTLHKIIAGLLDCYEVGGNRKALAVAEGMGDWVYDRLREVPTGTRIKMWNSYIAGEYGGMNEVMARLHRLTGQARFLECARLFDNIEFFFGDVGHSHGLAKNVDTIRGKHANQHIPQITGALETYRSTHDAEYHHVAEHFWNMATHDYMYAIGGVAGAANPANAECFTAQPDSLYKNGFATGGQNETCATYNLLKLSRELFMYDQTADYMDYYEQALYNHILASVAEDNPGNTYHVPLNPGSKKGFGNADMHGFTCCNGTAIESNTKLQDSIYFKSADNKMLYVNLYVPSKLDWRERAITLEQSTSFPYEDHTQLTVHGSGGFDLRVRVPRWAGQGFEVGINGKAQDVEAKPGSYLSLKREWQDGDKVTLRMPFDFHLSMVMDQPNIAAIFYGPVLLAAEEPEPRTEWRKITLDGENLANSFAGDPAKLRFEAGGVKFKPFFDTYDRNSVYLDVAFK
ncbi:MAG: glycoside hydrolase family 127 protein [Akkermansiaceae bacterium]|nr:glycoside hydrolase family 127 protein [Akkermansiaceae bacterium]